MPGTMNSRKTVCVSVSASAGCFACVAATRQGLVTNPPRRY